jgi:hypothetical protein
MSTTAISRQRADMPSFADYAAAGFLGEVLPILPPEATLIAGSKVAHDHRGKIPGEYHETVNKWTGFPDWTTRTFATTDIQRWDIWPDANIGLRAALFPAVDIDCSEASFVDAMLALVFEVFGETSVRGRENSARVLLPYRLRVRDEPPPKMRVVLHRSDLDPEAIEFLGRGQQYVIEGVHPTGARYAWRGMSPALLGSEELPEVTADQWRTFANAFAGF